MPTSGPVTELVIKRRLRARAAELSRPGIVWAATYSPHNVQPTANAGASQEDFDEASAIILGTIAEGEWRYKSPLEFFLELVSYPSEAIDALKRWCQIIQLREWAMNQPDLFAEGMYQAAYELSQTHPAIYAQLATDGRLNFDATTTAAPVSNEQLGASLNAALLGVQQQ